MIHCLLTATATGNIPRAVLSNDGALKNAPVFLGEAFGLPLQEIPTPPPDSKASPVPSLGFATG